MRYSSVLFTWAIAGSLALGCERFETQESFYPDFEAAVQANAVGDDRWIPSLLPKSAKEIHERHNLDTNEIWVSFRYAHEDLDPMTESCREAEKGTVGYPRAAPNEWWPEVLEDRTRRTEELVQQYEYFRCLRGS